MKEDKREDTSEDIRRAQGKGKTNVLVDEDKWLGMGVRRCGEYRHGGEVCLFLCCVPG